MSDRFVRWQGRTLEQMGYAINTLLVLANATLGFVISKLLDVDIYCCAKCLLTIGSTILLICIVTLLFLIMNRLYDFRSTTQNANDSNSKQNDTVKIGNRTWVLFYTAFSTFLLGEIFIVAGFAVHIL
jgi:hypothetical protein